MERKNEFIILEVEQEQYAISIYDVVSIERISNITEVPGAPYYIEGIMNLRGEIIPVISLRKRLNLQTISYDYMTRVIIVNPEENQIGIIVDKSNEFLTAIDKEIYYSEEIFKETDNDYIQGVIKINERIIQLFNLNKLLYIEE